MISDDDEHYLLDTNIISEMLKYKVNINVLKKMIEHSSDMDISSITVTEMLFGANILEDGLKKKIILDFIQKNVLEEFKIKPFTSEAAQIHAKIRATMKKAGKTISYDDSQIAAIALADEMTLVTRNIKHFEPITEFFPLKLENWFEE